jgi:hypothetical protein
LKPRRFGAALDPVFPIFLAFFHRNLEIFSLSQVSRAHQSAQCCLNGKNESFIFKLKRKKQPFCGSFKPREHDRFDPRFKAPPDPKIVTD